MDQRRAAHESIEGETLVIDTSSGQLLILTGFGSALWNTLVEGADLERLLEEVGQRYGADAADAVAAFVDILRDHEFLLDDTDDLGDQTGSGQGPLATWPDEFTSPAIETYDEIADIMTMDPIHQVDPDLGWPHTRSGSESLPPTAG